MRSSELSVYYSDYSGAQNTPGTFGNAQGGAGTDPCFTPRAHVPSQHGAAVPLPSPSRRGDEWRDCGAIAEMTGTHLLITCLLLNTLNSHLPTAPKSPRPHSRSPAAASCTQQLTGANEHLALASPIPHCSPTHLPARVLRP